ncbi:MAG: prepilin-type N-terminal cleavage/methylation domain-containing protein [Candidatus Omnitrophica bacterium]|nr:prepilin-type N-terminal cleavage/methylation domain-containing protein [Candidatus Omnitrophota bacterium]
MRKGFTLLELLIVVVVIAILASFAVPQYLSAVERTKGGKARHNLSIIMQAEKMCRSVNDSYVAIDDTPDDAACGGETLGDFVEMPDIDADSDWTYSSSGVGAAAITLTATRDAGPNATETITLDQDGTWGGNFAP